MRQHNVNKIFADSYDDIWSSKLQTSIPVNPLQSRIDLEKAMKTRAWQFPDLNMWYFKNLGPISDFIRNNRNVRATGKSTILL